MAAAGGRIDLTATHARLPLADAQADRLTAAVGDPPLALEQAGSQLADGVLDLDTYLGLLDRRAGELLAHDTGRTYPSGATAVTGRVALMRCQGHTLAIGHIAALVRRPEFSFVSLRRPACPARIMMGAGLPLFWAPIANASLSAARAHEQGQASGAATAVRELAIVLGIAVLASTFAAHASYGSPTAFIDGFRPTMEAGGRAGCVGLHVALLGPRSTPRRTGRRWRRCMRYTRAAPVVDQAFRRLAAVAGRPLT